MQIISNFTNSNLKQSKTQINKQNKQNKTEEKNKDKQKKTRKNQRIRKRKQEQTKNRNQKSKQTSIQIPNNQYSNSIIQQIQKPNHFKFQTIKNKNKTINKIIQVNQNK